MPTWYFREVCISFNQPEHKAAHDNVRLSMQGGSNGGLLMGAILTQVTPLAVLAIIHFASRCCFHPMQNPCYASLLELWSHFKVSCSVMQDPSMFGAVISQVGVYDMLRYQLFTIGESQHWSLCTSFPLACMRV